MKLCGHVILAVLMAVTVKIVVFLDVRRSRASVFIAVQILRHVERMTCSFDKGIKVSSRYSVHPTLEKYSKFMYTLGRAVA